MRWGRGCKTIKRKNTKQEKLHKLLIANPPKKKIVTECPLARKQRTSTLLTTQMHLHTMQIQKDGPNKRNTSIIKARQPIRGRSKPSIDKTSGHDSSIYCGIHL